MVTATGTITNSDYRASDAEGDPDLDEADARRALEQADAWEFVAAMPEGSAERGVLEAVLAADGPDKIERLSGMAHLTGIPVEVKPAAGPLAADSWSGLPEDRI